MANRPSNAPSNESSNEAATGPTLPQTAPPLAGIRILDLTHVLAGPFATYQLALMGAEVIRVERLGGDDFVRSHGGTQAMKDAGLGASFLSQNEGKQSMALDLKSDAGRQIFHRLVKTADIVTENFRPGVADRLGVGFEACVATNPDILYCSLSGYGDSGPLAGTPAYDHILQGISGMMAMTGTPESGPMRVGFPIVDYVAGQTMVAALLSALLGRERAETRGHHITISMLDAILGFMGPYAINHATTGALRGLEGNGAFSDSPFSGRFDTAEGQLVVTANTPAQAVRMAQALGQPDLAENADGNAVARALRRVLLGDSAEAWETRLGKVGVPAARVRSLAEILAHPQMQYSDLMRRVDVPELDTAVSVPGLAFAQSLWHVPPLASPPTMGRDTTQVLAGLGYSPDQIAALRDDRTVG